MELCEFAPCFSHSPFVWAFKVGVEIPLACIQQAQSVIKSSINHCNLTHHLCTASLQRKAPCNWLWEWQRKLLPSSDPCSLHSCCTRSCKKSRLNWSLPPAASDLPVYGTQHNLYRMYSKVPQTGNTKEHWGRASTLLEEGRERCARAGGRRGLWALGPSLRRRWAALRTLTGVKPPWSLCSHLCLGLTPTDMHSVERHVVSCIK